MLHYTILYCIILNRKAPRSPGDPLSDTTLDCMEREMMLIAEQNEELERPPIEKPKSLAPLQTIVPIVYV